MVFGKVLLNKINNRKDINKLVSNYFSLSILQAANYLLPFITYPYLVKVLGLDKFGLLMFAQAVMVYFAVIVDYGFNLSGTRQITTSKSNHSELQRIFSSIIYTKFVLTFFCLLILLVLIVTIDKFTQYNQLFLLSYLNIVGMFLFPTWFFQGIEKMKYAAIITLLPKITSTLSIFLLVNNQEQYLLVPLINGLGQIISGLWALIFIKNKYNINLISFSVNEIKEQLTSGWHIFISKFSTSIYIATNTFLLGIFGTNEVVGYYAIAEKSIRFITYLFSPISQAIYPHVVSLMSISKKQGYRFILKSLILVGILTTIIISIMIFYSNEIIGYVFGEESLYSVKIVNIFLPLIFITPISSIIYHVSIVSLGNDVVLTKATIIGAFFHICFIAIIMLMFNSILFTVAYSLVITETLLMLYGLNFLYKEYKKFNREKCVVY